jgi:chromate transporter
VKVARPLRQVPAAAVVALLAFVAIALVRLPLLTTMLVLTPISIWLASRGRMVPAGGRR